MNRRNALKTIGLSLGTSMVITDVLADLGNRSYTYCLADNARHKPLKKPVTAIVLGAGNRGGVYGNFALKFPEQLKMVGVAEPNGLRNDRFARLHKLPPSARFDTWEQVFDRPRFADAIIISTPDDLHYGPCMKALDKGYDILLEKPISPSEQECREILAKSKEKNNIVAVCHVLRYAPYFVKMRELIQKGAIGEIISIQHLEPIEHVHMAHSYVRGNWHDAEKTTPILLAKSCHDLDIIKWIINKSSKKIFAMGDLKWFRAENAPEGSTARCTDGCAIERSCPYSAIRIYHDRRERVLALNLPEDTEQHGKVIMEKLKTTNYGRCVYRMENNQPDHYITSIQFEGNVTASFSMEAFTSYHGRRTRIMGSMGDMVGDMQELVINDFRTREQTKFIPIAEDVEEYKNSGHGGGDHVMVKDFVQAVAQQDASILTSSLEESIESHIMGFMAEESRKSGQLKDIILSP